MCIYNFINLEFLHLVLQNTFMLVWSRVSEKVKKCYAIEKEYRIHFILEI